MATAADRQSERVMTYMKRGSVAGPPITDGGMNTSAGGARNAIGMIMITITTGITTTTESCRIR